MQSSFKETVEEIVARHHSLLRKDLPKITELLDSLSTDCPGSQSLGEAQQLYTKVRTKIETHLKDEETVLFPTGIALESGATVPPSEMDIIECLKEMEKEHDNCGNALTTLCGMINVVSQSRLRDQLLETIQLVQADLLIHADKENTLVHPRLIELLGVHALAP